MPAEPFGALAHLDYNPNNLRVEHLLRNLSLMQIHRGKLWILIASVYLILSAAYAILTPPWESPDEFAHYVYISELAARWSPPVPSTVRLTAPFYSDSAYMASNSHWFHPMVGYLPSAPVYAILRVVAPTSLPQKMPQLNPAFGSDPFKHPRLFVNTSSGVVESWQTNWGLLIMRILSSWWGIAVIYAAYQVGRWIDPASEWLGLAAAGWVAFLPQFTFIHATLRNDTLTDAIAALVLLLSAAIQVFGSKRNLLAGSIGILLGLGLLTKATFLAIVPVGFLAVVLAAPRSPRAWLKPWLWIGLPMVTLNAVYYLVYPEARMALAYTTNSFLATQPGALTWALLPTFVIQLFADLFYARFGWANVGPRSLFARAGALLWAVGVGWTIAQAIRSRTDPVRSPALKILILLGVGALLAILGVVRLNLADFQPQGRYLFPAIIAWPLLGGWGLWQVLPPQRKWLVAIAAPAAMLLFNLYSLSVLVAAYY